MKATLRGPHDQIQQPQGINPHASQPTSLVALSKSLWRNRQLIMQMTRREVAGRYKGSVMGLAWSFFNPVFMLAVYTFVFSVVFKARWGVGGEESKTQFAVVLFVGMIVHALLAEVLNRAPGLILGNANYVKKVVFPLEILPVISMGAALFHSLVSLGVLLIAFTLFNGYLHWTAVLVPLAVLPLVILTLGLAWRNKQKDTHFVQHKIRYALKFPHCLAATLGSASCQPSACSTGSSSGCCLWIRNSTICLIFTWNTRECRP